MKFSVPTHFLPDKVSFRLWNLTSLTGSANFVSTFHFEQSGGFPLRRKQKMGNQRKVSGWCCKNRTLRLRRFNFWLKLFFLEDFCHIYLFICLLIYIYIYSFCLSTGAKSFHLVSSDLFSSRLDVFLGRGGGKSQEKLTIFYQIQAEAIQITLSIFHPIWP